MVKWRRFLRRDAQSAITGRGFLTGGQKKLLELAAPSATFNPAIVRSLFDNLISSARSWAAKRAINCTKLAEYCAPFIAFGSAITEFPPKPTLQNR